MTEGNIHAKMLAATTLRPLYQAMADDEANAKNVRAQAACIVTLIDDVLPVYRAEADRQHEKARHDYEEARAAAEEETRKMDEFTQKVMGKEWRPIDRRLPDQPEN